MSRYLRLSLVVVLATVLVHEVAAQQPSSLRSITSEDILAGFKDPSAWLTYSGDYSGRRHSPLKSITPQNVKDLTPQWMFQTELAAPGRGFETTPLVVDGVMYATAIANGAWAIDARTGRSIWRYRRNLPTPLKVCCGQVNHGFAILGDRLFMGTLDAHLIALDRKTGAVVWDVPAAENKDGYSITMAPLVVKDKVLVGIAGGDYTARGFIDAYDAATGKRLWRFNVVPDPGAPGSQTWPGPEEMARGGGGLYATGSYDPALNLVYFGTGNPNPQYYGEDRKGDNLYTCSLVALDLETGTLRWHFQFSPHDTHDWDSSHVPVLADLTMGGQARKVVMVADRNGFFYVLDRETGKFLLGKPFTSAAPNWAREIGPDGRPVIIDNLGTPEKCIPDQRGGTNFMPPSYDPVRRLFFVTARETCTTWVSTKPTQATIALGTFVATGGPRRVAGGKDQFSALRAIDPTTGEIKWEHRFETYPSNIMLDLSGGATSTASGLVFSGNNEGFLNAFDSATGKLLWRFQTGAPVWGAPPVTYMLDGRQWVVVPSGVTLTAFALPGK